MMLSQHAGFRFRSARCFKLFLKKIQRLALSSPVSFLHMILHWTPVPYTGEDGDSRDWVLGWDGLAHQFHHGTWPDDECVTSIYEQRNPHADQFPVPLLFQEAGWFTWVQIRCSNLRSLLIYQTSPTLSFLLFGAIAGAVSLFLVEAMSTIQGNESFQAKVEYSTVAHLYLGDRPHLIMQGLLYLALQSVNLSSIIISEQVSDYSLPNAPSGE